MISMEQKQQIIIQHYRSSKSQREISRALGLSRNTVKKYISQYLSETGQDCGGDLQKAGVVKVPRYDSSNREKRKLTEEVVELIEGYLQQNQEKLLTGKSKQRMKGVDIHEALEEMGYQIGYTTVCGYIRTYLKREREVYIRQQYLPGDSVEFDWAEVKLSIKGKEKTLMLAVFTACYSNHRWAMLFYRQDMSSFLQSHVSYFSFVGSVAGELVYDNMRVAVRRFVQKNKEKEPTEELLKLSSYYGFAYRFCNAGKGNEKGHVERSVEFVRRKAFAREDQFESLAEANTYLEQVCIKLNQRHVRGHELSISEEFDKEKAHMLKAPLPYAGCKLTRLKVNKYSCIKLDNNHYSVREGHVGSWVDAKIYAHRLEVYDREANLLASHERRAGGYQWYIKLEHYLHNLVKKPGALARSEAFKQADPRLHQLFDQYFSPAPKIFIELLLWARKEQISIEEVIAATEKAKKTSLSSPMTLDKIQLLANKSMTEELHQFCAESPSPDPIRSFAAEQLDQIQALFSNP